MRERPHLRYPPIYYRDLAAGLLKQQRESDQFFALQAYRLNSVEFDWYLPKDSEPRGLLIANYKPLNGSTSAVVLTLSGELVLIDRVLDRGRYWGFEQYKLPSELANKYADLVEKRVDKKLKELGVVEKTVGATDNTSTSQGRDLFRPSDVSSGHEIRG